MASSCMELGCAHHPLLVADTPKSLTDSRLTITKMTIVAASKSERLKLFLVCTENDLVIR